MLRSMHNFSCMIVGKPFDLAGETPPVDAGPTETKAAQEANHCVHHVNAIDVCPSKRQFFCRRPQVEEHRGM